MSIVDNHLLFRSFEDKDIEAILRLWEVESGWGKVSRQQFDSWYINSFYGKSIIIVAEDLKTGDINGQVVFTPSRILLHGKEILALRLSSPILNKTLRHQTILDETHPVISMIQTGVQYAMDVGCQFIYTFPSVGWIKLFNNISSYFNNPAETALFDCFSIPLDMPENKLLENNNYVKISAGPNEEFETLWWKAVIQMPINCGIIRRINWLKRTIGNDLVIETREINSDQLLGYIAIKKESGLITDMLAKNYFDLELVLQNTINYLRCNKQTLRIPFKNLKGLLTSQLVPVLNNIGFSKDNFRFAFGSYLLDKNLDFEKLQASNWYLTPNG